MKIRITTASLAAGLVGTGVFAGPAFAAPIAVDGIIGSEWTGATKVSIGYDANAPVSNFGTPSTVSNTVAYDVLTRQDTGFLYVAVETNSAAGGSVGAALPFANLYFGGEINMTIGFEVMNGRAFIAGVPSWGTNGYKDFSTLAEAYMPAVGSDFTGPEKAIEFAIPISFFTDDPMDMGFAKLDGTAAHDFTRVNLSQSFGYSVAGGQTNFGDNRLGGFTSVPEPASLGLLGLAGLGLMGRRRRA